MKQILTRCNSYTIGIALLLTLSLTQCSVLKKNCCGYTGPIVSEEAIALYTIDHFIPKATIDEWTQRFETYKKNQNTDSSNSMVNDISSSYSYNGYYVNRVLCNNKSIGLRVLPGLDANYKLHFILVGIKLDNSNLYIEKPNSYFSLPKNQRAKFRTNIVDAETPAQSESILGGLQFSQRPHG